jgi:hypothetical protein
MNKHVWLVQMNLSDNTVMLAYSDPEIARKTVREFVKRHTDEGWEEVTDLWWRAGNKKDEVILHAATLDKDITD